jgi:hypothetical protein
VSGTLVNGVQSQHRIDPLAAYNAVNERDISDAVGWMPTLFETIDGTPAVPTLVPNKAGPFDW